MFTMLRTSVAVAVFAVAAVLAAACHSKTTTVAPGAGSAIAPTGATGGASYGGLGYSGHKKAR
jgi:hypothetical protein